MKMYYVWVRPPKESDANELGYVFARRRDRIGFEGVKWDQVSDKKHDIWHRIPKRKTNNPIRDSANSS